MVLMRTKIAAVLFISALCSAQTVTPAGKTANKAPITTIRSQGGLIVNGIHTPVGVNSAIVTPGDSFDTLGAAATVTYSDGRSVVLPASRHFTISKDTGSVVQGGANGQRENLGELTCLGVCFSFHK